MWPLLVVLQHDNMSNFSNPFKKQPTAKEAAKGVKKEVRSSQRELDRELRDIDRREAQLIADIKKQARDGRETSVRVLARNLVQLRSSRERLLKARGTVGSMSAQASAMAASITVADSLQKTSKVMHKMNASVQKSSAMSVAAFQKEAERMNMTEEAMGDMLSEAFDDDEDETDAVVGQVLAEVGLDTTKNLEDAPTAALPESEAAEADDTDQLLRQLNAL